MLDREDPVTDPLRTPGPMRTLVASMRRRLARLLRQLTRQGPAWLVAAAYILIGLGALDGLHRLGHADGPVTTASCGYRTCDAHACSSDTEPAAPPHSDHDCGSCWICIHLASSAGAVATATTLPRTLELVAIRDIPAPRWITSLAPPDDVAARPPPRG